MLRLSFQVLSGSWLFSKKGPAMIASPRDWDGAMALMGQGSNFGHKIGASLSPLPDFTSSKDR